MPETQFEEVQDCNGSTKVKKCIPKKVRYRQG